MLCLWAVGVVHRGVQPGEDGRGDVERQLLVEETLLLGLEHKDLAVHGHVPAARLRVHRQVLEVGHSWEEKKTDGGHPITPAQALPRTSTHVFSGALSGPRRGGCRAMVAGP